MNYTEIRDLALSYSDREDSDLSQRIGGFLYMVEAKINRILESNDMEFSTVITYVQDNQYFYNLPSDFGLIRSICKITDGDISSKQPYEHISAEQISWAKLNDSSNIYYSLNKGMLEVYPSLLVNESIYLRYIRHVPPLSSTNVTNWISIKYPDLYVFGLLIEISTFAKDWDAVNMHTERFNNILDDTVVRDARAKFSGQAMRTRVG